MSEISVIAYSVILGLLLLIVIVKYKELNTTILCVSLYFISGLTSIYYFYNGIYDYSTIKIFPILFIIICILITFLPVIKYDNVHNKRIIDNRGTYNFVYYSLLFFLCISIEPFLENIIHLPAVLQDQSSLSAIYTERVEGGNDDNEYLSWIGRKFFWINFLLRDIIPILLFYYLAKTKKCNRKIIIGSILSIMNPIIHSLEMGGRSTIISSSFYLLFVYSVFRSYLQENRRKYIDGILVCGVGLLVFAIAIITIARFSDNEHSIDIWTWVSLYTGEGALNFCVDLWPLDKTANGDNTFLMIRYLLGLTDNIDIESVRATRDVLGVRNLVFYTYLGTIYYDFNKIGTFIYVCIFSFLFCKICKAKKNGIRLGQLIYLSILGKVIMMGIMFYPYTLWNDQMTLLLLLIFTWTLNWKEKAYKYENLCSDTCL